MLVKMGGGSGQVELNIHYGQTAPADTSGLWVKTDKEPNSVALSGELGFSGASVTQITGYQYAPGIFLSDWADGGSSSSPRYLVNRGGGVYKGKYYFIGYVSGSMRMQVKLFAFDLSTHIYESLPSVLNIKWSDSYMGDDGAGAAVVDGRMVVYAHMSNDSSGSSGGNKERGLWIIDLETLVSTSYGDASYYYNDVRATADEVNGFVYISPVGYGTDDKGGNSRIRKIDPLSGVYTSLNLPGPIKSSYYGSSGAMCVTNDALYMFGGCSGSSSTGPSAHKAYVSTDGGTTWLEKTSTFDSNRFASWAGWMGGNTIYLIAERINSATQTEPAYLYSYDTVTDTYTLIAEINRNLGHWATSRGPRILYLAQVGTSYYYLTNQVDASAAMYPLRIDIGLSRTYEEGTLVIVISNSKNHTTLSKENPIIEIGVEKVYLYTDGTLIEQEAYTHETDSGWVAV